MKQTSGAARKPAEAVNRDTERFGVSLASVNR